MQLPRSPIQIVGSVALASVPFWLQELVSDDTKYFHLVNPEFLAPTLFFCIALLFIPQILNILGFIQRSVAKMAFAAFYSIRHMSFRKFFIFIPCFALLIIGLSNLMHGTAVYAFSLAREVKYLSEIGRQTLVQKANQLENNAGFGSSIPILELIVKRYPGDDRNPAIVKRIEVIRNAEILSTKLLGIANTEYKNGKYLSAAGLYWSAYQVFPKDGVAAKQLLELDRQLSDRENSVKKVYTACEAGHFPTQNDMREIAAYILLEPTILKISSKQKNNEGMRSNFKQSLCVEVLRIASAEEYYEALRSQYRIPNRSTE